MAEIFNAVILFGVLLIAGVVIRELVPAFQKFLLPAGLIAGFLGLILGQQILGWITIPNLFSEVASFGMRIMMTCIPIGVAVTGKKMAQHLDFAFANMILYGFQLIAGILLGAWLIGFWPGLPEGWGLLGVAAYFGGHPNISIVSGIIDPNNEFGVQSLGMVMATIGILVAIIPGMAIANFGVRRGWGAFTRDLSKQPKSFYSGALPEEKREDIGKLTINQSSVTPLAFQFGIIAVCYLFGELLFMGLKMVLPFTKHISPILYGLIGAMILWPIIQKVKLDRYVCKKTIKQINNFVLEAIILCATASIQLSVVGKFWVPMLLHAFILCLVTIVFTFVWFKKIGNPEWFEKGLMVYGMCTGSNPQGFALVRAVDPNNESSIYEALGVYNAMFFWNFLILPLAASLVLVNMVPIYAISLGLIIVPMLASFIIFRKMKSGNTNISA